MTCKTREEIITSMCFTFRHDYGIDKSEDDLISSGMTDIDRQALWLDMAQLFDHDIAPYMEFKNV